MSTALAGSPPQPASAETTVPPAALATQPSSLPATQDFASKVKGAITPADVRKMTDDLRAPAPPAAEPKPAEGKPQTAEAAPAETSAEEPAGGETHATPEGETPATERETPEADPNASPEGEPEAAEKNRFRLRLKTDDKVGKLAISIMRGDPSLTMEEALTHARAELGVKPQTEKPATPEQPKPNADLPQTVEAVDTLVERLEGERTKAAVDELDFKKVDEIDKQLRRLDRHRRDIERQTEQQQVEQAAAYDRSFSMAEQKAAELYDFAGKPESEGAKRMVEIEAELLANDDPLYYSPDKPLKIAQMVAAEKNIAPRKKGAPTTPVKPAPAPAAKKQILPNGSTVPPATSPNGEAAKRFEGIKSINDLRKEMAQLGVRQF